MSWKATSKQNPQYKIITATNARKVMTTMMNNTATMTNTITATITHSTRSKAIRCIETGEVFSSISKAGKRYNINHSLIGRMLLGKCEHAKGMHFEYIDQPDMIINDKPVEFKRHVTIQKEAIIEAKGKRDSGNCKSVMCITDGLNFASMTDAAEFYKTTPSQISYACGAKGRTAAGKQFCKFSELSLYVHEINDAINKKNAYYDLLEKENKRNELVANVRKLEEEVASLTAQLEAAKKSRDEAYAELVNFG